MPFENRYSPPIPSTYQPASSSALGAYESWVRRNAGWVKSIEDSLKTAVLFMPGRFGDAEIQSQSVYTALDLLSYYHDCVLNRPRIAFQCGQNTSQVRVAKALNSAVQYTEVLIEMIATRRLSRDQRWLVIILIEAAKTLARLYMLFSNRGNILVLGTDNEDVEPPAQLDAAAGRLPPEIPFRDILQLYASRGRGVHNPHGSFTEFTKPPVPPEQPWAPFHIAAAESLNILRPTVYAIARYVCADQSWKPFFLSLLVDGSSRYLIGDLSALTRDQQQEIARRMLLWAFYLLRTPFFDNFTKKHLSTVLGFLGRIPLLGIVFGNLLDLALELQAHHFYTSASSS